MAAPMHDIGNPRILPEPPAIPVVADGVVRPKWSVMIPVYNCAVYVPETLRSVLVQDPGREHMQIAVIDDCSTDADVDQIVRTVGEGRVEYFRQPANVGSLRNFLTCLERSRGHIVHLLHGDDRVHPGYYRTMEDLLERYPQAAAAFSRYDYIDESGNVMYSQMAEMEHAGILENWVERLCERQRVQYVAIAVRRAVYEKLGGFYGVDYGEDWEMWTRIAARYPMAYTPDVLASYRKHPDSISGRSFVTGKNMEDLVWVMRKIRSYLPASKQEQVMDESRKFYAHYALKIANSLWNDLRNRQGASAQVKAAWRMRKDIPLFFKILKLVARMTFNL